MQGAFRKKKVLRKQVRRERRIILGKSRHVAEQESVEVSIAVHTASMVHGTPGGMGTRVEEALHQHA